MRGLNHKEAVSYLRQTPATVTIRFYRPEQENEVAEITENLRNARKVNSLCSKYYVGFPKIPNI